jgi:lauroyl/myristoyl acyltransferase
MKEKRRKYHIYVRELKGADASSYARAFAKELTDVVSMYPDQWYNFYEFWQ